MSITSESAGAGRPKPELSATSIAQYNRRRYYGDYGNQPNVPSVGIKIDSGASTSAVLASKAQLGPKLWQPTSHLHAQRASTLASSSSSSLIPEAHYVENPQTVKLASLAATSASSTTGEEYAAKANPDAYQWNKKPSQWAHLGATRSAAAARRDEGKLSGLDALNRPPPEHAMDISKILVAAKQNADARIAAADNHLPADFGVRTEEEKYQRRQQVLSLISIADQRVKTKLAEMDRDANAQGNIFGSIEFQKLAMDVATKTHSGRLDNHGKLDLGGGLYMTQDEIDDIARRHVQPVLDKVQLVADKKRIADREAAERQAQQQQLQQEEREAARRQKAEEKQRAAEEKQKQKSQQAAAKAKAKRAAERVKENPEPGSHTWHWQQVEIIKEDVKEAKEQREEAAARAKALHAEHDQAQEDLAAIIERHRELKKDYFGRGEAIETKAAEYDPDAPETASLFDLKQQRETVKLSTKNAKIRRVELEETIERTDRQAKEADAEAEEAAKKHHDLKVKYFEARTEAEEAEKKFQAEEEARLKREAEERAEREREEAARREREAAEAREREAAEQRRREEEAVRPPTAPVAAAAGSSGAAAAAPAAAAPAAASKAAAAPAAASKAAAPAAKDKSKKKNKKDKAAPAAAAAPAVDYPAVADVKLPPKSKLISMGDARTGPVLSGYKSTVAPAKKSAAPKAEEAKAEEAKAEEAKAEETKVEAPGAEETKVEEPEAKAKAEAEAEAEAETEEAKAEPETKAEQAAEEAAEESKIEEPEEPKIEEPKVEEPEVKEPEAEEPEIKEPEVEAETEAAPAVEASESPEEALKEGASGDLASTSGIAPKSDQGSVVEAAEEAAEAEKPAAEAEKPAAEATEVPGVAGAVASGPAEDVTSDIPLGKEEKDAFSGFDSSNVKEQVDEKAPGLFKEDIQ